MKNILGILGAVSFVISGSLLGGTVFSVLWLKNPENQEEAKLILSEFQSQLYIGYSLGSLWLLKYKSYLPKNCQKAIIAPILAFLNKETTGFKD